MVHNYKDFLAIFQAFFNFHYTCKSCPPLGALKKDKNVFVFLNISSPPRILKPRTISKSSVRPSVVAIGAGIRCRGSGRVHKGTHLLQAPWSLPGGSLALKTQREGRDVPLCL